MRSGWAALYLALCACGRVGFDAAGEDAGGESSSGGDAGACTEPWGSPTEIPTGLDKPQAPSITANELELYLWTYDNMYVMTRADRSEAFGAPQLVPTVLIDGVGNYTPSISPDGLRLVFTSGRAGGAFIIQDTRATLSSAWGDEFDTGARGAGDQSTDGLHFYARDTGPATAWHRASTDDQFEPVGGEPLPAIIDGVGKPSISSDERELYFTGDDYVIWVARRDTADSTFTSTESTNVEGQQPEISPDGHHLYFETISDGGSVYHLWVVGRCE